MSEAKNSTPETERWFPNSMPAPMVDHHTLPFWEACSEHRLTVQRCQQCGHAQHPPSPICSNCRSTDFEQVEVSGKGTLYTYTAVHQPITYEEKLPFIIAVVELDMTGSDCTNTVRIMTNIVDAEDSELEIGQAVELAWEKISETVSIPRFKLAG